MYSVKLNFAFYFADRTDHENHENFMTAKISSPMVDVKMAGALGERAVCGWVGVE